MQVENHKEEVPFEHYVNLFRSLSPEDAQRRLPDVPWDGQCYCLTLLGREYRIAWPEYAMIPAEGNAVPPLPTQTFLLRYLLEGKSLPAGDGWKTFREMPWGELYHQPYNGRILTRAAFTFGTRLAAFQAAAEKLGGQRLPHGDAGYQFQLIGLYQMQLLLWEGDEEFPPSAQVLYSDNFSQGFSPEDRVVAGDILISHIKNLM
ncbi:MAG TPA: DUF3786 domain-containing protein [Candidatus Faecousia intestinigallinarum]|nr:DUF3786 domain-containing protein [Candidatus Faecousia intestinigallinarum]